MDSYASFNQPLHYENGHKNDINFIGSELIQSKLKACSMSNDTVLNINGFAIGPDDCFYLRSFLSDISSSANIAELNLADSSLGDHNASLLFGALKFHPSLKILNLKGNFLTSSCCNAVGSFLHENAVLSELILCWNGLGLCDSQFALLAAGLLVNSGLKSMDLRSNQLSSEAATKLGEAISQNRTLNLLDLRWNPGIGAVGGKGLMKSVSAFKGAKFVNLERLRLDGCNVPDDMVDIIQGWLGLSRERFRFFEREEKVLQTAKRQIESATAMQEQRIALLSEGLRKKDGELKYLDEKWAEKLSLIAEELAEARGNAISKKSRLATLESELVLEKQRSLDNQGQLNSAIENIRKSNTRASKAESALASLSAEFENKLQLEKSEMEFRKDDYEKDVNRLKTTLEESQRQRVELEGRVAKFAAEKAALEGELLNAKNETEMALVRERTSYQERLDMLERRWREAVSAGDTDRLNAEKQHSSALRDATDELNRLQRSVRELSQSLSKSQHELSQARDEADEATRRADKLERETKTSSTEFEELKDRVTSATLAERKATSRNRELERELEKANAELDDCKRKLDKLISALKTAQAMTRQLNTPLQQCLQLANAIESSAQE